MKLVFEILTILLMITFSFSFNGCSKSKSPVEPAKGDIDSLPNSPAITTQSHDIIAAYDCTIDPETKTFSVNPIERNPQYHTLLTGYHPDVLQITGFGYTPSFWADIKLTHPYPGSGIDVFDPRVIAILNANPGVSMYYPVFNVHANNSVILDPDGYTKLFDWAHPIAVGNTNPFIAYFKDRSNRVWSSTDVTEETRRWQMDLSGFGGPIRFVIVVDISTNYPNPPQPIIDNAPEPFIVDVSIDQGLMSDGGSADIEVTLLDWQGQSEIKCKVESPDLFDGAIQLFYSEPGPNPDEYIFSGTISNENLAPEGEYPVLIAAWDIPTDIHIFYEIEAMVTDDVFFDPVDVTSAILELNPTDIQVESNIAYVCSDLNGMQILDFSDPQNPVELSNIDPPKGAFQLFMVDGMAYVASSYKEFYIINVDPPENPVIINTFVPSHYFDVSDIYVADGYAYLASNTHSQLCIIDVDPPEDAFERYVIDFDRQFRSVAVKDGYAYVGENHVGLHVIDIDPFEDANIVKTLNSIRFAYCIRIRDDYAYVADWGDNLIVVDINPPQDANIVAIPDGYGTGYDIDIDDNYAYTSGYNHGLNILDIDPPEDTFLLNHVDTPGHAELVSHSNGYAYVVDVNDNRSDLFVMDVDPPEDASIVHSIEAVRHIRDVYIDGNFAYLTDFYDDRLLIVDISQPENAYLNTSFSMPGPANRVTVHDGYAFAAYYQGLQILDVDPLEDIQVVKAFNFPKYIKNIQIVGNLAYLADSDGFIHIMDIEVIEHAHIIKTIEINTHANDVHVLGDYAYVADYGDGLTIIDINPIEDAEIVKTVYDPGGASSVFATDEYTYMSNSSGLHIIDTNPVEDSSIIKSLIYGNAQDVTVVDGYAYVVVNNGLGIVDVSPPETAFIIDFIQTWDVYYGSGSSGVEVSDGYAYVAAEEAGLRIIDLR